MSELSRSLSAIDLKDIRLRGPAGSVATAFSRHLLSGEKSLEEFGQQISSMPARDRAEVLREGFRLSFESLELFRKVASEREKTQGAALREEGKGTLFESAAFASWQRSFRSEPKEDVAAIIERISNANRCDKRLIPSMGDSFLHALEDFIEASRPAATGYVIELLELAVELSQEHASQAIGSCNAGFPLMGAQSSARLARSVMERAEVCLVFQTPKGKEIHQKLNDCLRKESDIWRVAEGQYNESSF